MRTLKEYFKENKKEVGYNLYKRVVMKAEDIDNITKDEIYDSVIASYKNDPDIIINMGTVEEVSILKRLLNEDLKKQNNGYLEYLLIKNLKDNLLVFEDKDKYFIPLDLVNPIKMAINIFDEATYMYKDVSDSVMIGLIRIYNVLEVKEFKDILFSYNILLDDISIPEYIRINDRVRKYMRVLKYKDNMYVVSTEYEGYKDILAIRSNIKIRPNYVLQEVISVGKYKMDLFKECIFEFLSFLEQHLEQRYIDFIIDDVIVYAGYDAHSEKLIKSMASDISVLEQAIKEVVPYFPCWFYYGNSLNEIEKEISSRNVQKKSNVSKKNGWFNGLFKKRDKGAK